MKVNNTFNAQIAALAMPGKSNALTIIGAGLEKFSKDSYDNAVKELSLEQMRAKVHDDRLGAEYIAKRGGLKLDDGESFLTTSGAKSAFGLENSLIARARAERAEQRANAMHNLSMAYKKLSIDRIRQNMALANKREARAAARFNMLMKKAKSAGDLAGVSRGGGKVITLKIGDGGVSASTAAKSFTPAKKEEKIDFSNIELTD